MSVNSYESGAIKSVTSIGDKCVLVETTVDEAGTDEAYVESPFEDKAVVAKVVMEVSVVLVGCVNYVVSFALDVADGTWLDGL